MDLNDVIDKWDDNADKFNQWSDLDDQEKVHHVYTTLTQRMSELEVMCEKQAAILRKDDCGCPCCELTTEARKKVKGLEAERVERENKMSAMNSLIIDLQASLRAINTQATLEHAADMRTMINYCPALTTNSKGGVNE
jgi:hypothetical protein